VRCLIECDDKLLFIRQTYGDRRWSVPGGGINRNETPEEAVQREVSEEVGLRLLNVSFLGRFVSTYEFKNDAVHCYFGRVDNLTLNLDPNEIQEAKWFSVKALPKLQSSHAQMILRLYHARSLSISILNEEAD
jgi:mutator protein MutT